MRNYSPLTNSLHRSHTKIQSLLIYIVDLLGKLRHELLQLAVICGVLAVALSAAPAPERRIAVGTAEAQAYLENFWLPERNAQGTFRWTDGSGIIWLRDYTNATALNVSIRVAGPTSADANPLPLTFRTDERTVGVVPITTRWRTYHMLLSPNGATWRTPNIDLQSPVMRAGTNDLRKLGVVISDVTITPLGGQLLLPIMLRALYLATLVVLVRLACQVVVPARYAITISLIVGLAAALLWRGNPAKIEQMLPAPWYIALGISSIGIILIYVKQWRQSSTQMSDSALQATYRRAYALFIAPLVITLIVTVLLSLRWRMLQDSPLLMYIAFLIDHYHALPYRDVFDQNMPGALAIYLLVGRLFGYSDIGFRIADICVLILLSLCTWRWCSRINPRYAVAAVVLFDLLYLSYGQSVSMQRDYVLLLPISAALAVSTLRWNWQTRSFLIGLLFGIAATIKPQAVIGLPIILAFLIAEHTDQLTAARLKILGISILGMLLPIVACAIYLYASGAMNDFLDMVVHYLPLFAQITGEHETISGTARIWYLLDGLADFGHHYVWLVTALIGIVIALRWAGLATAQRRQVFVMLGMLVCYSLYPLAQGRFWDYHWLPCLYCLALLSALCVLPQPKASRLAGQAAALVALTLAVALRIGLPVELSYQASGHPLPPIKDGRVDQIAAFLQKNAQPGATVQPLDWTGGALQGMLNAGVRVATPFIYYFQFTHHVSTPYIQQLRQRFITDLNIAQPQFIIDMGDYNTVITGSDTNSTFPELQAILTHNYTIVFHENGYIIYQRK